MFKRIRAVREDDNGFTLTELLITIVILGVLAGIVVFAVTGFTNDGRTVACNADRKNVEIAVEAYKAKSATNSYPADPDAGGPLDAIDALVSSNYLKQRPSNNGYTINLGDGTGVVSVSTPGGGTACP